jgi:hypothetical protein
MPLDVYHTISLNFCLLENEAAVELFDIFRVAFDIICVFELVQTTDLFDRTQARVSTNLKHVSR